MFYFTGCPCKHGHVDRRLTSNASCCGCNNKYRRDNVTASAKRNVEWKTKNPEKVRKHRKSQYLRHGEEVRAKKKLWYRANTESQISYSKKWRRDNPERHTIYQRAYEQKHKERDRTRKYETIARWRRNNPEFVRSRCAHRRALKRGAEGDHSKTDLDVLFKWQNGKCAYCRRPFINKKYSIDHIQALHNGGSDWPENLQLLCKSCNCKKSVADPLVFLLNFSKAVRKRWLRRLLLRLDLLIKRFVRTVGS